MPIPAFAFFIATMLGGTAAAQTPQIFRDVDLELGEKLLRDNRCAECHARKVGGNGASIYRPRGKINSPGALRGMVDFCSTELNLGLFPEEVTAVAAVLNRDHYHFGVGAAPAARPASGR